MRKKNGNAKNKMLHLIAYCNSQISNTTDLMIASTILKMTENNVTLSLEQLAEQASVSQASVYRFIRKAGFENYDDFRNCYLNAVLEMNINRKKMHRQTFGVIDDPKKIPDILYENALSNMLESGRKTDLKQIRRVVRILQEAGCVTCVGNEHELSEFHTVQLDLIGEGVPVFLQYNANLQKSLLKYLQDGDVIVVINVFEKWLGEDLRNEIAAIREKKRIRTIGFFQEDVPELRQLFDEYVLYGEPDSHNQGFFSLMLISQLISEMLYEG
ncbi:MAG: MurR/RpiR family transcriptional regulator [Bulleidia sp.]